MYLFQKLSVVIPAYNEEKTIKSVLTKLTTVELIKNIQMELLVVNDCSKDNTEKEVESFIKENPSVDIKYFKHEVNKGKGAALHTGIKNATGQYLIVQDADLEYDPEEFNILIKPITDGHADVVYGSRFMGGNAHRILFFWHTIGNKFLTFYPTCFLI
jgi:glycosyltransferase involved in cell wall biosynthesis